MNGRVAVCIAGAWLLAACQEPSAEPERDAAAPSMVGSLPDDHYPSSLSREEFHRLMKEKSQVADRLMRDLLYGDFMGIATRAGRLQQISLQAELERGPTPEYAVLAEDFRVSLDSMVEAAQDQNVSGLLDAQGAMNRACLQCHATLRDGVGQ